MENGKKLRKSEERKICGVCGGIGEYLGVDPTVVRLLWILFCFAGGSGILAYIIAAVIMPDQYFNEIRDGPFHTFCRKGTVLFYISNVKI